MKNLRVINYNSQKLDKQDFYHVNQSLKQRLISKGKYLIKFEAGLKKYFGSKYSLVVSNATCAFFLLFKQLKYSKKNFVILSPITFVAAANALSFYGCKVIFSDISLDDYNLDVNEVETLILKYKKKKIKISAIVVTDFGGAPAKWKQFKKLKKKYGITLINDNCHAMGSKIDSNKKYAVKYADFVVQSYHAVKNFTSAEGGAILLNNKKNFEELKMLREHGFEPQKKKWQYELKNPGFNFRLSEPNCALGFSQLKKLDDNVKKRVLLSNIYSEKFKNSEFFNIPNEIYNMKNSFHIYPLRIKFEKLKISKDNFIEILKKKFKINLQVHYKPTYKFEFYKSKKNKKLFLTEKFYKEVVSLPLHLNLGKKEINYVINSILFLIKKYRKKKWPIFQ